MRKYEPVGYFVKSQILFEKERLTQILKINKGF